MVETRYRNPEAIVSAAWLAANLAEPGLRIYDCTTYLAYESGTGRPYSVVSGRADYQAGHIPGSGFLDLQAELSESDSPYSFTLPSLERLAADFGRAGIGDDGRVVLYSRKTLQWSTRIWWMLRTIGFDRAAILDGGWDKWALEGRPVSTEPVAYPAATLTLRPRPELFVGREAVRAALGDPETCIINALLPELHRGENDRYGRPGRIRGSVNVPAASLQDPKTLALVCPAAAAAAFAAVGALPEKRALVYCGGGIAATLDAFLLHQLGYGEVAVYDASMSEWARDESLPMETGPIETG